MAAAAVHQDAVQVAAVVIDKKGSSKPWLNILL